MELLESIKNRRSIKKYLDLEVPIEKIGMVIDAGASAPSSGNIQNWRFVIVKDKESRKRLADTALQQYWIETAPVCIVVCAVIDTAKQFYGIRGEKLYSIQNCAAAIQNMLLMATALDLGSLWRTVFSRQADALGKLLDLPEFIRVMSVIEVGYLVNKNRAPPKRKVEEFSHRDGYDKGRIIEAKEAWLKRAIHSPRQSKR